MFRPDPNGAELARFSNDAEYFAGAELTEQGFRGSIGRCRIDCVNADPPRPVKYALRGRRRDFSGNIGDAVVTTELRRSKPELYHGRPTNLRTGHIPSIRDRSSSRLSHTVFVSES